VMGSNLTSTIATNWTTAGWTTGSGTATHTVGNTNALSTSNITAIVGRDYIVTYTITASGTGLLLTSMGGVNIGFNNFSGTYTQFVTATTTAGLSFTPETGVTSTISDVSVQLLTATSATLAVADSAGTRTIELRSGGTTGSTYIGPNTGRYSTSAATLNTIVGSNNFTSNITGSNNTAIGTNLLNMNTQGNNNIAIGRFNVNGATGNNNIGIGRDNLYGNGNSNIAIGYSANNGGAGSSNIGLGNSALVFGTGSYNIGIGSNGRYGQGTGSVGIGNNTGQFGTGLYNTAIGEYAGSSDILASRFVFAGNGSANYTTSIGVGALSITSDTVILGRDSTTTNVGIGTISPTNKLSVNGGFYYEGGGYNNDDGCLGGSVSQSGTTLTFNIYGGNCSEPFLSTDVGSEVVMSGNQKAIITGFTNSTTVTVTPSQTVAAETSFRLYRAGLQVTSAGIAGIGTTTPGAQLEVIVQGSTTRGALTVNNRDSTGNILNLQDNGSSVFTVADGGAVTYTAGTANTATSVCRNASGQLAGCTSASRYKDDVQDLNLGLEELRLLQPVSYTWNTNGQADIGFLAEQVASVIPQAVTYDENGEIASFNYNTVTALLTNATKQLDLKVTSLEQRVADLEAGILSVQTITTTNLTTNTLTVTGTTTLATLKVGGKIITAGATPLAETGAINTVGQGATIILAGNDTAGSVTYTSGNVNAPSFDLATGAQLKATFTSPYGAPPRIALTAKSATSAGMRYYVDTTTTGFIIYFLDIPQPNTTYSFDYILLQ